MNASIGNRDLIRAINRSSILNIIKSDGPIARAEIARIIGLSPATVTGITADLIKEELVEEVSLGDSSGGRPPILLALKPSGGYVIGIKLMEDHLICALTDLEANVVSQQNISFHTKKPDQAAREISQAVKDTLAKADIPRAKLMGVGVGLAGVVDNERGLVRYSPFFGWKNVPLGQKIGSALDVPVYIDNDVNTFAVAESLFGSAEDERDFITVTIGRGIGLGIMSNGVPFRGATGGAGEFGHLVIDEDGPVCSCGNQGCLEVYASEPAVIKRANQILNKKVETIEELVALAKEGNPDIVAILADAGKLIGNKIADLITLMGPRLVIVSGEGTRMGDYLFRPMVEAVKERVMPAVRGSYEIRVEPWGDDAWARGAACLVLKQIFVSPYV